MTDQVAMSESEKKKEDWMNSKWRPMMGWLYMGTCTFDFVIFPILWSLLQAVTHAPQITQWQPLTLQGAGLYHIAMGAVLGLAAFGRTQEKLAGANNGGASTLPTGGFTAPSAPSTGFSAPAGGFGAPAATPAPTGFSAGGFGSTPPATPASSFGGGFGSAKPIVASNGKLGPAPAEDPVL